MSGPNALLTKTFVAEAAITKRRIVKLGAANGAVLQAAAATDAMFGVAAELDAAIGERVDVHVGGIVEIEAGAAIARGALVTADALGRAITATRHTHVENTAAAYTQNAVTQAGSGQRAIGIAMTDALAAGDIIPVLFAPAFA